MNEKYLKYFMWFFFGLVLWSFLQGPREENYNINIMAQTNAADGLDLQAVGSLVKKAKNAEDLEKMLNNPGEAINNLDLNEDDKVDYIKVTEYGSGKSRGFSLTVEPQRGEKQEIATIDVESVNDKEANVEIHGNEQIYGHNHYYRSNFSFGEMMLMGYLFSPHRLYMSPWGYGYYPSYYNAYRPMSASRYRSTASRSARSSNMRSAKSSSMKSAARSPNAGRSASSIKAPLRNPTTSQKSFQSRNPSRNLRSGGFGRSARPSVRSAGFRRSGGAFGGK